MWWPRSATCSKRPKRPKRSKTFRFAKLMRVYGQSMAPLLRPGALVLVDESAYHHRAPERGEIVAARPMSLGGKAVVKRVVGLPHERVSLNHRSWALASGEYLLLGDARDESLDSRAFGPVTYQELVGRVWLCCWPLRRLSSVLPS